MSWRQTQLDWYKGDLLRQDADLIEFIQHHQIKSVTYYGQSEFLNLLLDLPQAESSDLAIYIVNSIFRYSDIVNDIKNNMAYNKFIYISINKFLAIPEPQNKVVDDYDAAIYNYVLENLNLGLLKYYSGKDDRGHRFNWAHPLTRFYFLNENIR